MNNENQPSIEDLREAAQEIYNQGRESDDPDERQECFDEQQNLDRQADEIELEQMEKGNDGDH